MCRVPSASRPRRASVPSREPLSPAQRTVVAGYLLVLFALALLLIWATQ